MEPRDDIERMEEMDGDELRLMCVLAHPDDESMGTGGVLAKYAAEGIATFLVCATRGERGWTGDTASQPDLEVLGRLREAELHAAAEILGIRRIDFLDYLDGDLDRADPMEAASRIARLLREVRPHVVVTFAPDGAYGHPDHIAINQFTTAACLLAADAGFELRSWSPPHRVAKLYFLVVGFDFAAAIAEAAGEISIEVDGVTRSEVVWPEWAITTTVDCTGYWRTVWQAICRHRSQLATLGDLDRLTEDLHRRIWCQQRFFRAFSLVNGGRTVEDDLFAGLR